MMVTLAVRPHRKASELRRDELMTVFKQWLVMFTIMFIVALLISSCPWTVSPPTQRSKEVRRTY